MREMNEEGNGIEREKGLGLVSHTTVFNAFCFLFEYSAGVRVIQIVTLNARMLHGIIIVENQPSARVKGKCDHTTKRFSS